MTNLFALCLIVTSLTAAGLWSPSPAADHNHNDFDQDIIVKQGHRVVVVEYGDHGRHDTKVSISPEPQADVSHYPYHNLNSDNPSDDSASERHRTRDLICDAFGKCKHKIASAMEKAKLSVSESMQEARDVGEAVSDAFDKAEQTVSDKSQQVKTSVSEKAHRVKESVEKAREKLGRDAREQANESLEKIRDLKESVKEYANRAEETLKEAKERGNKVGEEVLESAEKQAVEKGREARQTAEKMKAGANKVKENSYRRSIVILGGGLKLVNDTVRYLGSAESLKAVMDVLSVLGFAMAFGMGVWTTFISSYVLANALPGQQLAVVQSKIYPVYFRAMASSIGMALLGHLFSHTQWVFSTKAEIFQGYILLAALLMNFANSLYMEPQATKVMFERLKMEKKEGRGIEDITAEPRHVTDTAKATTTSTATVSASLQAAEVVDREVVKSRIVGLNQRLKKLNSYSSLLNLLTLMALTWHLVYLSQRLCVSRG